ncbi:MAG: NUDIX domain-containing protein [Bacteroidales bacterium]|nr:NUDIX domain-containing protein [Bacteroidales bacterium]
MKSNFVAKILLTFLPIVIFLIADYFFEPKISIIIAIIVTIIQFTLFLIKEKEVDFFLLFDLALITLLGLISIHFENESFFKLKPAILEIIFVPVILLFIVNQNFLKKYLNRYTPGNNYVNDFITKKLQKKLSVLLTMIVIHVFLIIYSAYNLSTKEWGFISGALLYIMIGAYFFTELIINRLKMYGKEYIPVINEKGEVIGKKLKSIVHSCNNEEKLLHPVVHLHVINKKGEILLQKRSNRKNVEPGKWDTAVGGHVKFNEKIEDCIIRESREELNVLFNNYTFLKSYIWETDIEKELVFTYATITDYVNVKGIRYNKKEISEIKFWKIEEIENLKKDNEFTPNFLKEFEFVKLFIKKSL